MDRRAYLLILLPLILFCVSGPVHAQGTSPFETDTPGEIKVEDVVDTVANRGDTILQYQVGLKAFQEGDLPQAISRLQRSYHADTQFARARYWLAQVHYADGNNDSALALWRGIPEQSDVSDWAERELEMHRQRYRNPSSSMSMSSEWEFSGMIPGRRAGSVRLTNPSALEPAPDGGWFVASYQLGKVVHYSTEGRILRSVRGFEKPIDLAYVDRLGLLVSNGEQGTIQRISDTGAVTTWSDQGIGSPMKILQVKERLYVFDSAGEQITQLSRTGDTIVVIREAGPRQDFSDVSVGPDGNFWVLETRTGQLLILNRYGEISRRLPLSNLPDMQRIWWDEGHLFGATLDGLHLIEPDNGSSRKIKVSQGEIEGRDVFGIDHYGDQVVVALFQESGLALYRTGENNSRELLIQPRKLDVRRFPVVRLDLILEDANRTGRFTHLTDRELTIDVDGRKVLPGLLRPSHSLYSPHWIMIVDNRVDQRQRWEEIRPSLIDFIEGAPSDALGAVWKSSSEQNQVIQQGFTRKNILLRNALRRMDVEVGPSSRADTVLPELINSALDVSFRNRGPTGIILVSSQIPTDGKSFKQVSQRLKNNRVPLVLVNPTNQRLDPDYPLRAIPENRYHDFYNLDELSRGWDFYQDILRSHYTIVYKSSLDFQQSNEWRPYQLTFHYFDQTNRYSNAFLMP